MATVSAPLTATQAVGNTFAPLATNSTVTPPPPPVTLPPTVTASPDNTLITTVGPVITDANGHTWGIGSGGQVVIDGVADTTTGRVIELAYEKGAIWQENADKLWWGKAKPGDGWNLGAGTTASPILAASPPPVAGGTIGSGSDTITLQMSEDADGPAGAAGRDAEFTVSVDGKQIGGLQTVTASHAAGRTEAFVFAGNWAPGSHDITVTFANNTGTQGDKLNPNDGGDRNLYVNSVAYDGAAVTTTTTPIYTSPLFPPNGTLDPGNAVFHITDATAVPPNAPSTPTTTPIPVSFGTGSDTLTLKMSEDPYQGDAQFTVTVDGNPVGGTLTTSAISWEGQTQEYDLKGTWGTGTHKIAITFTNDAHGAVDAQGNAYDATDRNLYINSVSFDGGTPATGTPWELYSDGSRTFTATGGNPTTNPPPPVITPSPDNTVITTVGPAITDAAGNTWGITAGGQVSINGAADTKTGRVIEIAYEKGTIYQENADRLWWGEAKPGDGWNVSPSSSTSPVPPTTAPPPVTPPPSVTLDPANPNPVVNASNQPVNGTGTFSLYLAGTGDTITVTGGNEKLMLFGQGSNVATTGAGNDTLYLASVKNTVDAGAGQNSIIDSAGSNTFVMPAIGKGFDSFWGAIGADTLDFRATLAGTAWNGSASTLGQYMTITTKGTDAIVSASTTAGGTGTPIATLYGAGHTTLAQLLTHSVT